MPFRKSLYFYIFIALYFVGLTVVAATTPITSSEAYLLYHPSPTVAQKLISIFQELITGELGLRVPFLMFGVVNAFLFLQVAKHTLPKIEDAFVALSIYLLLPGVMVSTTIANDAVVISFLILLFLYLYLDKKIVMAAIPLGLLGFVQWSGFVIYLSLALYSVANKERYLLVVIALASVFNLAVGVDFANLPSGSYFFDMLGVDAAILSPLVFVYLFYALYRVLLRGGRGVVWYISFVPLIASLLLCMSVKITVMDFSSYIMLGVIVAVASYYDSLRVRLRRFRRWYEVSFAVVLFSLLANALFMLLHQPIYRASGSKHSSVMAPVYEPYDDAMRLRKQKLKCIHNPKSRAIDQLRYYGIKKCS